MIGWIYMSKVLVTVDKMERLWLNIWREVDKAGKESARTVMYGEQ